MTVNLIELNYAFNQIHESINQSSSGSADLKYVRDNIPDELEVSNERLLLMVENVRNIIDFNSAGFRLAASKYKESLPNDAFDTWKKLRSAAIMTYQIWLRHWDKAETDLETIIDRFWLGECAIMALWPYTAGITFRGRPPMDDWTDFDNSTKIPYFTLGRELDDYESTQVERLFDKVPESPTKWLDRKREAFSNVQETLDWLKNELSKTKGIAFRVNDDGTKTLVEFEELQTGLLVAPQSFKVSQLLVIAAKEHFEALKLRESQLATTSKVIVKPPSPRRGNKIEIEGAFRNLITDSENNRVELSEVELLKTLKLQFSNITRDRVREMRKEMVPAKWTKPGRRPRSE